MCQLHTYIIGHYNPSVRITHVVCGNFIHEWRDQQFNVDFERKIFVNLFHGRLITLKVFGRNLLRGNRRNFFFMFRFDA